MEAENGGSTSICTYTGSDWRDCNTNICRKFLRADVILCFCSYTCFLGLMADLDILHKDLRNWGGLTITSLIISYFILRHREEQEDAMLPSMTAAHMCALRVDRSQGAATLTTAVKFYYLFQILLRLILMPLFQPSQPPGAPGTCGRPVVRPAGEG